MLETCTAFVFAELCNIGKTWKVYAIVKDGLQNNQIEKVSFLIYSFVS